MNSLERLCATVRSTIARSLAMRLRQRVAILTAFSGMMWVCTPWVHGSDTPLSPTDLRCEYLVNPLGIDVVRPRLSWRLESAKPDARGQRQAAYQVLAAGRG